MTMDANIKEKKKFIFIIFFKSSYIIRFRWC